MNSQTRIGPIEAGVCAVQREAFAKIVHREGEGIVGALFSAQPLHAFPGLQRLCGGSLCRTGTVTVVQQRGEQRRRRRHRAAPLGQRQRGMLMTQQIGQQRVRLPHTRPPLPLLQSECAPAGC